MRTKQAKRRRGAVHLIAPSAAASPPHYSGFYKQVLDNLYDGLYIVDRDRRINYWNKAAERLTGYPAEQVLGRGCADNLLMHVDVSGCLLCTGDCPLNHAMTEGVGREAEVYVRHRLGYRVPVFVRVGPIRNAQGEIVGAVEIFNDNSSTKAAQEKIEQLEQMAFLDALTQVGNRRYLEEKLSQHLQEHARHGSSFGVLLIDVDAFKSINDTHGHNAGDATLASTAKTISGCLRTSDVLGRWGGDEYLAIAPGITREGLQHLAQRCRTLVQRSNVVVEGKVLKVTVSVGATLARPNDTVTSVVARADESLYRSKTCGRNRVTIAYPHASSEKRARTA